jgi:hypothetical protein
MQNTRTRYRTTSRAIAVRSTPVQKASSGIRWQSRNGADVRHEMG